MGPDVSCEGGDRPMSKSRFCWVSLGSWGLGIKWYSTDRILAMQLGRQQFEIQFREPINGIWS